MPKNYIISQILDEKFVIVQLLDYLKNTLRSSSKLESKISQANNNPFIASPLTGQMELPLTVLELT